MPWNSDNKNSIDKVAKIINSTKGQLKTNTNGFLFIKDRNHADLNHWICNRKNWKESKCNLSAVTVLTNGTNIIRKSYSFSHNHAAEASKLFFLKALNEIKEVLKNCNHRHAQIINNIISSLAPDMQPCFTWFWSQKIHHNEILISLCRNI